VHGKWRRWLAVGTVMVLFWTAADLALHVAVLAPLYRASPAMWRPMAEISASLVFAIRIALAGCLIVLYEVTVRPKSVRSGLAFGSIVGVMLGVAVGAGTYVHMPISSAIAAGWFAGAVLKTTLTGALLGWTLGDRREAHESRPTSSAAIATRWVSLWSAPVDWALFHEIHADDFHDESSAGRPADRDGFAAGLRAFVAAFPDVRTTVEDLVVDARTSRVAVRWKAVGTNATAYLGVGPTHRLTTITGIEIIEIRGGRVVRRWGEWDITGHTADR